MAKVYTSHEIDHMPVEWIEMALGLPALGHQVIVELDTESVAAGIRSAIDAEEDPRGFHWDVCISGSVSRMSGRVVRWQPMPRAKERA